MGVPTVPDSIAQEVAPYRIRVNSISPTGVKTPMWKTMPFFQELMAKEGGEEAAFQLLSELGAADQKQPALLRVEEVLPRTRKRLALGLGAALGVLTAFGNFTAELVEHRPTTRRTPPGHGY